MCFWCEQVSLVLWVKLTNIPSIQWYPRLCSLLEDPVSCSQLVSLATPPYLHSFSQLELAAFDCGQ